MTEKMFCRRLNHEHQIPTNTAEVMNQYQLADYTAQGELYQPRRRRIYGGPEAGRGFGLRGGRIGQYGGRDPLGHIGGSGGLGGLRTQSLGQNNDLGNDKGFHFLSSLRSGIDEAVKLGGLGTRPLGLGELGGLGQRDCSALLAHRARRDRDRDLGLGLGGCRSLDPLMSGGLGVGLWAIKEPSSTDWGTQIGPRIAYKTPYISERSQAPSRREFRNLRIHQIERRSLAKLLSVGLLQKPPPLVKMPLSLVQRSPPGRKLRNSHAPGMTIHQRQSRGPAKPRLLSVNLPKPPSIILQSPPLIQRRPPRRSLQGLSFPALLIDDGDSQ